MKRIALRIQQNPPEVEIVCNLLRRDSGHEKLIAFMDTGAEVSLFPLYLMDVIKVYQPTDVILQQGGIGALTIEAVQATVAIAFEDSDGNVTSFREVQVWFADTEVALIGFEGVLDQGVLHIDIPAQNGWLQID
jgi:hypothetical protein